jgi:hypothetical protein
LRATHKTRSDSPQYTKSFFARTNARQIFVM